jgi:hypothetical protein
MLLTGVKIGLRCICVELKGFTAYVWMQSFEVNPYVDEKGLNVLLRPVYPSKLHYYF